MNSMNSTSANPAHKYQGWIYSILVILSVGGVAIMDYSVKYGFWYWLAMAVVFGAASIGLAWKSDQDTPGDQSERVKKQALHWGTLIVGILLVFLMQNAQVINASTSGLMALLLLSITAALAGVHFNWRMAVVGLILAATFVAAVLAETFFWYLLIIAFVAVIVIFQFRRKAA